jgi:hypothetical protein
LVGLLIDGKLPSKAMLFAFMALWPIGCVLRETAAPPALERKDGGCGDILFMGCSFVFSKRESILFCFKMNFTYTVQGR